jgi:hypothetical protein
MKKHKHHLSPGSLPVAAGFADASVDAFNTLRAAPFIRCLATLDALRLRRPRCHQPSPYLG